MTMSVCPRCQSPMSGSGQEAYCPRCAGRLLLGTSDGGDSADSLPPKTILRLGEYELGAELGRGAMGVVYRARQPRLTREVAVKVILASRFAGDAARKRFLAEAELAAQLDHPNIVPIYEVGETPDGPFYAMKLVEGGTLADQLIRSSRREEAHSKIQERSEPPHVGCYVVKGAAALLAKIARAVHHAHQRGVLHRDLKPGNILLDGQGEPHVTDFGLARQLGVDSSLTHSGSSIGTPAYMSPEQARGDKGISTASDVWSLGAILYHLIAGRPPFEGDTAVEVMRKVMEEEPAPPSKCEVRDERRESSLRLLPRSSPLSPDLETICLKCLEKDPARRYASALDLAEDLERWLKHEPIRARPSTTSERLRKWVRRRPARAAGLALLTLVVLTGVAGITWQWRRAEQNASHARARLLQMHLLNVQHSFNEGDPLSALPWLASALEQDAPGSFQRDAYKLSFASSLRAAVLPERMWFLPGHAIGIQISADGQWVAASSTAIEGMVWRMDTGEPVVPATAIKGAWTLALSPDSRRMVLGDGDGARLYELPSGRMVAKLEQREPSNQFAFTEDSRWLATGGGRGEVRVWSAADGLPVTELLPHSYFVGSVAFSPDGTLLTVDRERAMILWDVTTGRERRRREGEFYWYAQFSSDGKRIVASVGNEARIYDAVTLEPFGERMPHASLIVRLCFSPDGQRVATASRDGAARVWDALTGQPVTPPLRHNAEVHSLAFSPDGRALATGSLDFNARVWDAASGQPLTPWLRHGGLVNSVSFAPDGQHLATSSGDGTARLWRLRRADAGSLALAGTSPPLKSAWTSPDSTTLVTRDQSNRVSFWSTATGRQLNAGHETTMEFRRALFSADGRKVLLEDSTNVWLLDMADFTTSIRLQPPREGNLQIAWHPGGRSFFTASEGGKVLEWDAATGVQRRELPRAKSLTSLLRASSDGLWLAAAERSKLHLWTLEDGEQRTSPKLDNLDFHTVRFSPDGQLLAAGAEDGTVGLLATDSARWLAGPLIHPGRIFDLEFSPDSRQLAVVANDGVVRIRDARTGRLRSAPLRPPGGALRGRFSPDGRLLGTGSLLTGQIWDVATGGPVTPVFHFSHRIVEGPVFSPDARTVFFVTADARLIRHRLDAPEWPAEVWPLAARFLSGHVATEGGSLEIWRPGEGAAEDWNQLRERLVQAGLIGDGQP